MIPEGRVRACALCMAELHTGCWDTVEMFAEIKDVTTGPVHEVLDATIVVGAKQWNKKVLPGCALLQCNNMCGLCVKFMDAVVVSAQATA